MEVLSCTAQNYDWGKRGSNSMVAKIKKLGDKNFEIEEAKAYAELWMGTHPSGPSKSISTGELLGQILKSSAASVGLVPPGSPEDDLPFMLKVLSIRTALSIQAHPDRNLGRELHLKQPNHYKDPNHKPEMAIALTDFEGMCGFRPISEIKTNLTAFPELALLIGETETYAFLNAKVSDESPEEDKKNVIKSLFKAFIYCSDEISDAGIEKLLTRISLETASRNHNHDTLHSDTPPSALDWNNDEYYLMNLMYRLHVDFPLDRGILCPLLLNCIRLSPGEAFFMGPNEPHAYISGDIVECMALSDNTVRAGLTTKFKDVNTLCSMLHYRPPSDLCAEFEVEKAVYPPHIAVNNSPPSVPCGSLVIILKGNVTVIIDQISYDLSEGMVVFVAANKILNVITRQEGVELFRAHTNLGLL